MDQLLIQFNATRNYNVIKCNRIKELYIELNKLWFGRFILGTDFIIDKEINHV